jgi:hypothetical protein
LPTQPNGATTIVFECTAGVFGAGTTLPPGPDMIVRLLSPAPPHGTLPTTGTLISDRPDVNLPVNTYDFGAAPALPRERQERSGGD